MWEKVHSKPTTPKGQPRKSKISISSVPGAKKKKNNNNFKCHTGGGKKNIFPEILNGKSVPNKYFGLNLQCYCTFEKMFRQTV